MSANVTFAPSPSVFGFSSLGRLPGMLRERGFERVLIVTDSWISRSGLLEQLLDQLDGSVTAKIYDAVPAEPTDEELERVSIEVSFDALIGFGGGSSMDFAKALSILVSHGGAMRDYVGEGTVPGPTVPVVCVPTTSGTGSQSTQTTVFTIDGVKSGASSEYIRPVFSVVDPGLTMALPPTITRNSGYDALMHAIESFLARPSEEVPERPILYQGSNPYSRCLSLEAFRVVWGSYRRAISDGGDRAARQAMSLGSHLAGLAFSHSGLGLVHTLASALGGMIQAPHGICLAACTSIGLRYNAEFCEAGLAALGEAAGLGGLVESAKTRAERFLDSLQGLIRDVGFPCRPSELGITKADSSILLEKTLVQKRRLPTNPRVIGEGFLPFLEDGI